MGDYYRLDRYGEPERVPDVLEWAKWFETANRTVMRTRLSPTAYVSTVFLGIDHSFGGDVPLLYESMLFEENGNQDQRRYPTRDDATHGHMEMVNEWCAAHGEPPKYVAKNTTPEPVKALTLPDGKTRTITMEDD